MAFTSSAFTAFFEQSNQMGLSSRARTRLAQEGLASIDDLADFKEDQLTQAFRNMRTAVPGVPPVTRNNRTVSPAIEAIPLIVVSAKCGLRLKIASRAYHYYVSIDRDPTPGNMHYTSVLQDFHVEYEAMESLRDEDKPDVPILHKNLTPLKWIESFKDCLYRTFGVRKCPLLYVIRDQIIPDSEDDDPLLPNQPFGVSGSIINELIKRVSHDGPLYKSDNATVYSMLEEATQNCVYALTIKPFSRRKDGRSAWMAMISSHAGADKWEKLQKDRIRFMMNSKWNGRTYSLEKFTNLHRASFIQLQEASLYVDFQLPSEHTRVTYLIDNLLNNDSDLRAAIASIRVNIDGMRSNFEAAVAFLLPVDPLVKHKEKLHKAPQISNVTLKGKAQSRTGVDLRWHTPDEYRTLSREQKNELYEWQKTKEGRNTTNKQKSETKYRTRPNIKKRLQARINALEVKLKNVEDSKFTSKENNSNIATGHTTCSINRDTHDRSDPDQTYKAYSMAAQGILKRRRNNI